MAKSRFLTYLEYIPAKCIMVMLRLFPYRLAVRAGSVFGMMVYLITPGQRRIVYDNLQTAFGDSMSPPEKKKLVRRVFRNVGKTIFEFMQFPKLSREKLLKLVSFENLEAMDRALAKGKGVIGITGHIGNWEMLAAAFAATGRPLHAIVRPLDNPLLDKYVESFRENKGVHIVPRGAALKGGLRALKGGSVLAFVMDQNAAMHGIFVPFFNKLAATVQGPAILAGHYRSPVVFCYDRRNKDNSHTLVFRDEIPYTEGKDKEDTILCNTKRYTKEIEEVIRENPEQWLWLHPRWRKRPPEEELAGKES